MSEIEIAWLAGLFEGEATFGFQSENVRPKRVRITIAMTDKDVIRRVYETLGSGYFNENSPRVREDRKPLWIVSLGSQKDCKDLMQLFSPHMGERRLAKFEELIKHIDENPLAWNRGEGGNHGSWRRMRKCDCKLCKQALEERRKWGRDHYKLMKERQ